MLDTNKAKLLLDTAQRAAALATVVYAVTFGEEAWERQNRAWARLDTATIAFRQMKGA